MIIIQKLSKKEAKDKKKKMTLGKYKVAFVQKEKFIVDVLAKNEKQAIKLAEKKWNAGDYQETGNITVETDTVYDVTNTDDPFNP